MTVASYMNSNQPYSRVDDGIGAGLVSGAAIGAAGMGATQMMMRKKARNEYQKALSTPAIGEGSGSTSHGPKGQSYTKHFGSKKRMAGRYGMAAAAGGLIGGLIDGANN